MISMSAATALLRVDPATLRRWCSAANVQFIADPVDHRRHYIAMPDLVRLANLHGRYVPGGSAARHLGHECELSAVISQELADIRKEIAELRDQIAQCGRVW